MGRNVERSNYIIAKFDPRDQYTLQKLVSKSKRDFSSEQIAKIEKKKSKNRSRWNNWEQEARHLALLNNNARYKETEFSLAWYLDKFSWKNDVFALFRAEYDSSCVAPSYSGMTNKYVKKKPRINVVVIGHVDSGKSTLAGRLLCEVGAVCKPMIEQLGKESAKIGRGSFKYAWVLDKLNKEREIGNTIGISLWKFKTAKYSCTIFDTPGQKAFIKNMITGTAQADLALLVVDTSKDGFEDQTREHALIAFTLGVTQMICCLTKMDATRYSETRFNSVVAEVSLYLKNVGYNTGKIPFVPVSGLEGDNMVSRSGKLHWYYGPTLLDAIDSILEPKRFFDKPLRLPLHGVYNIRGIGTVPVGKVETGIIRPGMNIIFGPTGLSTEVISVERNHKSLLEGRPGDFVGFSVMDVSVGQLKPGYVASSSEDDPARCAASFTARVVVLHGSVQIRKDYEAILDIHTSHTKIKFESLVSKIDRITGKEIEINPGFLEAGDAGMVVIIPTKPLVVETFSDYPALGRFTVRDEDETIAVGVVIEVDKKDQT